MNDDVVNWLRQPGLGKYAKIERERRFLLSEMPSEASKPRLIEDRYIVGTRLRLRRVEVGSQVVYKFCQKVRPDENEPSTVAITNIYLDEPEYRKLCLLPAATLRKTRRIWRIGHDTFVVDEFHDDLAGLLLAEIELPDSSYNLSLPPQIGTEVTDERFSGGYLAHASSDEKAHLLT
ncbi:CYTH domain-containing protein [Nocardia tengchongensis]|uniref:CYTH domain-containing protein n=1 Tax=Nocardia tengchongensis TaxID=2055889 RepID=UPI0036BCDE90